MGALSTNRGAQGRGWQARGGLHTVPQPEAFLSQHPLILAVLMRLLSNWAPSLHSIPEPWGNKLRGGGDKPK